MVDNVLDGAFSWQGTFLLVSAVVFGRFCIRFGVDSLSVVG